MFDLDELERRWREAPVASGEGRVELLVVRRAPGEHETPARVELIAGGGIAGDRWADGGHADAQVSLIERRSVEALTGERAGWHVPGDNVVVDLELSEEALPVGTRLAIGTALVEISGKPHLGCAKFRARLGEPALAWVNSETGRPRRLRGVYCRVLDAGVVAVGDRVTVTARP
jgi:MOSC domain-containing protein YiiM